jgi:hypothetical protein
MDGVELDRAWPGRAWQGSARPGKARLIGVFFKDKEMVKKKKKQKKRGKLITRNLVIVSDIHAGCGMGLCPPGGAILDDGGHYMPSGAQMKAWDCWVDFWHSWVPRVTKGEPYVVCHNGDAIDGVHHGTITQISHNLTIQRNIAVQILYPIVNDPKCIGYFHLRGTEAHGGKSGQEEEALAKELGAIPDNGKCARWELWIRVGKALCHISHHIGATGSAMYEATAVNRELVNEYVAAGQWENEPPTFVARSHRHRHCEVSVPCKKGYGKAFVTAGWQLKTPLVFRMGMKSQPPQLGGSVIRQGDEDSYTRHKVYSIDRPAVIGE